ncbi:MAG: hypothetical protein P1U32_08280 [Legionellaceae bacterium]|nr:hypothetical protein [Legionellaceae bacterium]
MTISNKKMLFSLSVFSLIFCSSLQARPGTLFPLTRKTAATIDIPEGASARAIYEVRSNTLVPHYLTLHPIPGVQVISERADNCSPPFRLNKNEACNLVLEIAIDAVTNSQITPKVCNTVTPPFLCSQADPSSRVYVRKIAAATKTAVGVNQSTPEDTPLLVQTRNGGISWRTVDVSQTPDGGQFFNTACGGTSPGTYCLAVGGTPDNAPAYTVPPFIVSTMNDGQTWRSTPIVGAPALGNFYGTSCTDDAQFCNAVGDAIFYDDTGTTITSAPLLIAQSQDYGKNWHVKAISGTNVPANASFISSSCANRNGAATLCAASGQISEVPGDLKSTSNHPLLAQTTDGGDSWSIVTVNGAPTYGYFYHVNCTQSGDRALCVTVGQDYATTSPLLAQTNTSGAVWNTVPLPTFVKDGYLNDIACSGPRCVAVGATFETKPDGSRIYQPLIFQTVNSGASWNVAGIEGVSAIKNGMLYSVHVTGSGESTMFVTAGANYGTKKPLLVQTTDGAKRWTLVHVPNEPLGWYNTVSCSGKLSTANCTAVGQIGLSPSAPLITQTRNGGTHWSVVPSKSIKGLPNQGVFYWGGSTGG